MIETATGTDWCWWIWDNNSTCRPDE